MTRPRPAAIGLGLALGLAFALSAALPKSLSAAEGEGKPASVTFLPSPSSPLVALRFIFRVGSEHDPRGKEGLAALTAAMVAEGGTKELSYELLLQKFYPMAAELSSACRKEVTVFDGEVHRDNLAEYSRLAVSMLTTPRFAKEDFERLRSEALDYVSKTLRANNDEELGKWTLQLELFKNHPYGHVDQGTVEGLKAITLDDVREFHRTHYTLGALHLGVAGGASRASVDGLIASLNALPKGDVALPELPRPAIPDGLDVTLVEKPTASTAISLGFPIDVTRRDDDFYALAVANSYLGEHRTFNGKLMQDLRGKRGLNYGDYSYIENFIQDGPGTFPVPNNPRRQQAFTIWIRPVPHDKAAFALRAALWELNRLVEDGMSRDDFEFTRSYLLNYSKLWIQTLPRRLGYAMDGPFYGRDDLVSELGSRLPKLTVEQVNDAVRRHLKPPGMRVAIITQNAAALRDVLKSGKATPITYDTKGTPDSILAEDKQIEAFPLTNLRARVIPVEQLFER
jgi:zinc protease